ncbi:MAG: four helix bundle protein [Chloroflexi bacterium]|nr:four helix bundle protein [Chloroflexota bacterium]
MGDLVFAKSFQELVVYQKARRLQHEIFQITKTFPRDEMFSLTDQIRRSSRSVGANIAEAWAKRRYDKHFLSKLTDAEGEEFETQHWVGTALDCEYISQAQAKTLMDKCEEIGRMLGSMMAKADLFCGEEYKVMRESVAEYFANSPDDAKN